ncbi:uncharacterized protein M6B38_132555 [Iris pallida]|uniref:Uncharacterized protein n=1 Tax=Iris pallida TaxID=29817 RepID=A0AAX6FH20_IRIPA|nr:uncharacterized protein M6B38_132555 [Iris pallida]
MPKRKELSSSSSSSAAMAGTFTRSRSEIFLHRTRSGRARPDPSKRHRPIPPSLPSSSSSAGVVVKDLRLKRVFSDRTVTKAEIDPPKNIEGPAVIESPSKEPGGGPVDDPVESDSSGKGSNRQTEVDRVAETKSLDLDSSNRSNIKSGLSRCSRSKLIGNPRSFSYKRLLPYLKDLAKDVSNGMEVHLNNQPFKAEKTIEDKLSLLSAQQNHIAPLEGPSTTLSGNFRELEGSLELISKDNIPQTTASGSPDAYSERSFQAQQVACKMAANDSVMANIDKLEKGTGSDFEEQHKLDIQENITQTTVVESPDSCSRGKLQVCEATCKTGNNDEEMKDINRLDKEETSEEMNGGTIGILIGCDDNVQGTPPDADFVSKLDSAEGGKRTNLLETELCNISKNRVGPASSSRSKLFRNPSSFSYRRLLPYIMDLAKDGSSGMTILHPKNHTTTTEKNIDERPYTSNIDPSSALQHQSIPSGDTPPATSVLNQQSEENPYSERHGLSFQEDNCSSVTMVPLISLDETKSQIYECKSDLPQERSDNEFEMVYRRLSSCFPTIGEDLSVQELTGNLQEPSYSPLKMDKKPIQGAYQLESCGHGGIRPLAPRKSILKKQTRRCKGICICLDCSLFRVHAERAFEFSRKQMLEADEVAEGLMKELACLRNLVERIVMPVADRRGTYTSLQLNQEQVKGICQKASRVEEAAKGRMREMIVDLNTHCKIPGPRVSFSEVVGKQNVP